VPDPFVVGGQPPLPRWGAARRFGAQLGEDTPDGRLDVPPCDDGVEVGA
jgi:hypothetical protein